MIRHTQLRIAFCWYHLHAFNLVGAVVVPPFVRIVLAANTDEVDRSVTERASGRWALFRILSRDNARMSRDNMRLGGHATSGNLRPIAT